MTTDDQTSSTPSGSKRPKSRKHRIQTVGNNGLSKLPSLLSKSNSFLSQSETTYFKKYRPQKKDVLNTSSSRIERQTTSINPQARLPPLSTTINDHNNKQKSDFQRRQIYALNHLMRELEQEQFRQFCKTNGIGSENSNATVTNTEESNQQSIASV